VSVSRTLVGSWIVVPQLTILISLSIDGPSFDDPHLRGRTSFGPAHTQSRQDILPSHTEPTVQSRLRKDTKIQYKDSENEPACNTLQHTATHCNTLQRTHAQTSVVPVWLCLSTSIAIHCSILQDTATCCNILRHTPAHKSQMLTGWLWL